MYISREVGYARFAREALRLARTNAQSTFSFRSSQRTPVSFSMVGQCSAGTPLTSHC